jgi:NAD-dependent dihydropyrimidine dehydrogenase PreA subunit
VAKSVVRIETDLCENEQVCEAVCPAGVFALDRGSVVVAKPQDCTLCFKCAESCPSGAIELDY